MTVAPGFRAVVFALRDLPPSDQRYLAEVAHALGWPPEREPALWDTPLLLGRQSDTPPVPGLRSDDEVAANGPSVLLLAMRLLLADALQWPELRFLELDLHRDVPDYVLYAADPTRWTPASLADSLVAGGTATASGVAATTAITTACWHIQRGLQHRPQRLPPVPGDRVPVLGLQVPLFGGRQANLLDLRPLAEQLRAPVHPGALVRSATSRSAALPTGTTAGHHQGRYSLSLLIHSISDSTDLDNEEAQVELTLFRLDTSTGTTQKAALRLLARELSGLHDAEAGQLTPLALSEWLAELLPSCFLVAPTGDVLLVDWFHLDLAVDPDPTTPPAEFTLRPCGTPGHTEQLAEANDSDDNDDREAEDWALLDPAMWSLSGLADLLAAADLTLSASGRYLWLESAIPLDGELTHLSALLDTTAAGGLHILRCTLGDEDAPPPAHVPNDPFPTLRGDLAAPGTIA